MTVNAAQMQAWKEMWAAGIDPLLGDGQLPARARRKPAPRAPDSEAQADAPEGESPEAPMAPES